ncbi:MAG: hypothetical protein RL095_4133 [Verrucomicrobiota bacterium]|jgi:hypothetical protein
MIRIAACLFACLPLAAAELDTDSIPADTRLVLHLDCERFQKGQIGAALLEIIGRDAAATQRLDALKNLSGIDLRRDLKGVTLFSKASRPGEGTLMVHGRIDRDKILSFAKLAEDHRSSPHEGVELHSWTPRKGAGQRLAWMAFPRPDLMILSDSKESLAAVIDTAAGRAERLAPTGLAALLPKDRTFVAAASGLDSLPAGRPASPLLRQIKDFSLSMGEVEGQIDMQLDLNAIDDTAAQQLKTMLDGFVAMAKMQADPEGLKVLDGIAIKQVAASLSSRCGIDARQLAEQMKAKAGRDQAARAARNAAPR